MDACSARGRKRAEEHLPHLLPDIRDLVNGQSQTDPRFQTTRLYTRLSAAEVRRQLLQQKGYTAAELPTLQTINTQLRDLGYYPKKVTKSKPVKKIPETDAIFDQLHQVHQTAQERDDTLRLSIDAKATVKIGPFSRGGKSRVPRAAVDHDFQPQETLTLFGILLPQYDDLFLYGTSSKVTSDFIVDVLEQWWETVQSRFPQVTTWVLNQDNGPEQHSRRTQFIKRLVGFAQDHHLTVRLAYYPPYHSKYNPIERSWGILENHWNGDLLDSVETALHFAQTMTWKGKHPLVTLVTKTYATGVKLSPPEMEALETQIKRLPGLEKWFVDIPANPAAAWDN